jgi:hypothetical protein
MRRLAEFSCELSMSCERWVTLVNYRLSLLRHGIPLPNTALMRERLSPAIDSPLPARVDPSATIAAFVGVLHSRSRSTGKFGCLNASRFVAELTNSASVGTFARAIAVIIYPPKLFKSLITVLPVWKTFELNS